ncbi:MAG TPA: FeoA family protein [bacterium]|nr:FeoA family protein [bacterium]HNH30702.1 FeoA family protein [bacterium]HNO12031.1 FeoA family protein [bacterium]
MKDHTATPKITLDSVPIGASVRIADMHIYGMARRRLLDFGFLRDEPIEVVSRSPFGDPTAYRVKGTLIALRREEAKKIEVVL